MQAGTPTRPALAVAAMLAGLALGATPLPRTRTTRIAAGTAALAVPAIALTAAHGAVTSVASTRATLGSPERSAALRAAWDTARAHLLTGAGPGITRLVDTSGSGTGVFRYAHNEYVQVLAELGIPGLVLLLAFLALAARALLRSRTDLTFTAAALAACAALAAHAGLDFLWHLPAIPLLAAALAGLAAPEPPARPITAVPTAVPTERGQQ
jgi:O-antigen ligase